MLIDKFQKNSLEEIRTEIIEFQGKKYLNIRVWYNAGNGNKPDFRPTPKGLTLNVDLVDNLKEAISKAAKEIYKKLPGA